MGVGVQVALAGFVGLAIGLAFGLGGAAAMLARARRGTTPIDLPDERRLHTTPTPRGGGIGIPLAGLAVLPLGLVAAAGSFDRRLVLVGCLVWALPNGLIGLIDDHRPLRSRVKFALQAAFAIAACALGLRLDRIDLPPFAPVELGVAAWPLSVLWLLWNANVFNFMDGMDGLAAASGILFFGAFGAWALAAGLGGTAVFALALAGALVGFLRYNYPPAKIFMGDAGSLFVGGALGALSLGLGRPEGAGVPIVASTILMGTFVWDATYTIARRALRGDPMLPHRTHLYQRLAVAGWSHDRVRALYLGLAVAFALAALVLPSLPRAAAGLVIVTALAACAALVVVTQRAERSR